MNFKFLINKKINLVVVDDGSGYWGIVTKHNSVIASNYFQDDANSKNAIEFGKKHHAQNILFLNNKEIRELDIKLGVGLSKEERKSAIEYAASSDVGDHSDSQRISFIDGMLHDFRSGVFVSYFDIHEINELETVAKSNKLNFLGALNIKQLLLAEHFSELNHHNNALLFLLENNGFVAIPDRNKLTVRNLPFGVPQGQGDKEEWLQRAQRRLIGLQDKYITLYSPSASVELSEEIVEFSQAKSVELEDWSTALNDSINFYFAQKNQVIYPARPVPKAKDPKVSGTYLGIFLVFVTILSMIFLITKNHFVKQDLDQTYEVNQEIVNTVKIEKLKLKKIQTNSTKAKAIMIMMKNQQRVSKDFIIVINLLSRYPLKYTKITQIHEKNNGIHITGESLWQVDFSKFFHHFKNELTKLGLALQSVGITKGEKNKIIFKARVFKGKLK